MARELKDSKSAVPRFLAATAVPQSLTGTLVETVLASIIVPAGIMQANGRLNIHSLFNVSNNANVKELFIRLGGTGINGAIMMHQYIATATTKGWYGYSKISNRGAMNSQIGDPEYGNGGGQFGEFGNGYYTGAVDMSQQQTLFITGKLGNVADTITLQSYEVELIPKS
jgi:hypothetical protein